MYKLNDFVREKSSLGDEPISPFIKLLKSKWDEIHSKPNVLRYKMSNVQQKRVDEKYILILNPDRGTNRRTPEHIKDVRQPFDDEKFNFTKVALEEIMFNIESDEDEEIMFNIESDEDEHVFLVNVSPITHYHTLLCPSTAKKHPQVITADSLSLALNIMFLAQDCDLKIVFNSLCGLASVNHMHYHLIIDKHIWPVELVKQKHIKGALYCIQDYPVPAFCFLICKDSIEANVIEVFKLIQYFLDKSIAHNIVITMRAMSVSVYIWPRKSAAGVKETGVMNVAACELSGWITVYSAEAFEKLQSEDLETELKKWKIDDFDTLCKDLEFLY